MRHTIVVTAFIIATASACSAPENQKTAAIDGPSAFAYTPSDYPKLTVANWQNEKVTVLGNPKTGYLSTAKMIGGDKSPLHDRPDIYLENKPDEGLPNDTYAGKTGTVASDTNSRAADGSFVSGQYTIVLDGSGERIVTARSDYLCPSSLLEKIKSSLDGKTVWAKGRFSLYAPGDPPEAFPTTGSNSIPIHPLDKLRISVEPGVASAQICIRARTEDSREGCIYVGTDVGGGIGFWTMVFPAQECPVHKVEWDANRFFFVADPAASHHDWTAETWSQIKNGQVTVGMTDEMVSAACGPAFHFDAVRTTSSAGVTTTDWIHGCCANQPSFAIAGGRVSRFVR